MILLIINIYTQIFEIFISPKCVYNYVLYNIKHFDINCLIGIIPLMNQCNVTREDHDLDQ